MAERPRTAFRRVKELPEAIRECMGYSDPGTPPEAAWRYGYLARDTVVYSSGRIAREGIPVRHAVDPAELALCRKLATAAKSIKPVYPASEGDFFWETFFIVANEDEPAPERIDGALIRERFGGTILPIASIFIEPIAERSPWWEDSMRSVYQGCQHLAQLVVKVDRDVWWERSMSVARALDARDLKIDGERKRDQREVDRIVQALVPGEDDISDTEKSTAREILAQLRLIRFFRGQGFRDAAYVRIGDRYDAARDQNDRWPPGLGAWPSCVPCLLIGLTQGGSLTGLVGHIVAT
jgi:hypothetical protein